MRALEGNMDFLSSDMSQKLFEMNAMVARERSVDPSSIMHPNFMSFAPGFVDMHHD